MPKRRPVVREHEKIESEQEYDRRKVFYGRVSTFEQNLDMQIAFADAENIHPDNRFIEKISAQASRRPQWELLLKFLQPGDTLYVWSTSRISRDVMDFLRINKDLMEMGVAIVSKTEPVDSRTAMGKFMVIMYAAFHQLERDTAIERTRAGLAARKESGHQLGAKPKLSPEQIARAKKDLAKKGASVASVAKKYGVSAATLTTWTGGKAAALKAAKKTK